MRNTFRQISELWDAKIPDLATLKERLPGSVLVGLDIEHFNIDGIQHASEVGVAVLQVQGQSPPFFHGLAQFYEESGVEALTMRVRDRVGLKPQYEDPEKRYGEKVHTNEENIPEITTETLSKYEGTRILVVFDTNAEMKWMSETCPSFASLFSAWVDAQELLAHRIEPEHLALAVA
ncbi:hypothetical protein BDV95DRAFT_320789 [Massariosphaeria phaeospora]|uniref:Uncharacterized protein n=1 Tax=Massariosphaeria phaeospora TaxID=100035 RepID=A0A7C8MD56_9PLEO|nr:hypothetical protein BDV95DRAFT_320789 [Massariosphaeria phaeospora]